MTFVAKSSAPRRLWPGLASPGVASQTRSRRLGATVRRLFISSHHLRRLIVAYSAALRQTASRLRRFSITCLRVPRLHFDDSGLEIIGLATSIEA